MAEMREAIHETNEIISTQYTPLTSMRITTRAKYNAAAAKSDLNEASTPNTTHRTTTTYNTPYPNINSSTPNNLPQHSTKERAETFLRMNWMKSMQQRVRSRKWVYGS